MQAEVLRCPHSCPHFDKRRRSAVGLCQEDGPEHHGPDQFHVGRAQPVANLRPECLVERETIRMVLWEATAGENAEEHRVRIAWDPVE